MTTNTATQARRATAIEGWITPPRNLHQGKPSEGHSSAVEVLRLMGKRPMLTFSEPVPFHSRPAPLRSIKQPKGMGAGCTHDCEQGHRCTCEPVVTKPPTAKRPGTTMRSVLGWLSTVVVFCLLALAMVLMGKPQDH